MKKIIVIPIISLLLFFVLSSVVSAATPVISLNPASQNINVGNTFAVTLKVSDMADLGTLAADILFDGSKITYDHLAISSDLAGLNWTAEAFDCAAPSQNCKNFLVMSDSVNFLNGQADIMTIYFTAQAAGVSDFSYANKFASDSLFAEITSSWNPAAVTITVPASSAKEIASFNFIGLAPAVTGVISGTDISLTVPYGTDVTALAPTIAVSTDASVSPASGVAQNFTSPVVYTVTAADGSTKSYVVNVTIAANPNPAPTPEPVTGGAILPPWPTSYPAPTPEPQPQVVRLPSKIPQQVLGVKIASAAEIQLNQILADAIAVWSENIDTILTSSQAGARDFEQEKITADKYLANLIHDEKNFSAANIFRLNWFITYGTATTKALGAGERAGVISSYLAAFGKLPKTELEWQDAIKIANGRWPSERSAAAETKAKVSFKKIYGREPNLDNANDDAAVSIMAYGLRPSQRNTDSEKTAILSFKYFFKRAPVSAADWDAVRAIAYSGAKR